jgi:uncharacterized protein (TIGR00106 family)
MAIAEVSVVPLGTGTTSVSRYVAAALRTLRLVEGISYELTGMGTIIQGEMPVLLAAIAKMHESVFLLGAHRVVTTVRIDDRRDKPATPEAKVAAVTQQLQH